MVTVRAAAYKDGLLPSEVTTATYIFPEQVLSQPNRPAGFPSDWNGQPADYELDDTVLGNAGYRAEALEALTSAPTLSIVADVNDLFGSSGIYANPSREGVAWERACSAEMIYPDGSKGFQTNCGIRIQGGSSTHNWKSIKVSMRLLFKGDYGPAKLRFPLFPDSPVKRFDTVVLDAHLNLVWTHPSHGQRVRGQYIRDNFSSDLQNAMGSLAPYSIWANVYLNGIHWGMYEIHDRPDTSFAAEHLGGEKEGYDLFKHDGGQLMEGTRAAWDTMRGIARGGLAGNEDYESLGNYLDIPDLCDYMIMNIYVGNDDWPRHNWYAARSRVLPGSKFRFFSWDAEHVLKDVSINQTGVNDSQSPAEFFQLLRDNAEFRLLCADHVHRHFFNGGVLYVDSSRPDWDPEAPERNRPASLYMKRIREIENLIVLESARWGDARRPGEPYTKDNEWQNELDWLIDDYFPARSSRVLSQFRSADLYPDVGAPVFNQHGGPITAGFNLTMTRPAGTSGTIYYTLDGTDPREYGTGSISDSARTYDAPVALTASTTVKARVRQASTWSALNQAHFRVTSSFDDLRITEVMYHPLDTGELGDDQYEFIEIKNTGGAVLDLGGVALTRGVFFTFPAGAILDPGEFAVLVSNGAAFAERYPGVAVHGTYSGRLDNDWDTIVMTDPLGQILVSFTYCDSAWWPREPDGDGFSLVPRGPAGESDLNDPAAWKPSTLILGSPGADDDAAEPAAPRIVRHPRDLTVLEGEKAAFSAIATGFPVPTYQWERNGAAIPGANELVYTLPATNAADNGARFRCIVTNEEGTATSDQATLTVAVGLNRFRRGDATGDGRTDVSDAVGILRILFAGAAAPCEDAADTNDDGTIDVADAVTLLAYLFSGGAPPPAPFQTCGFDPTDGDDLGCSAFAPCN